MRMLLLLLPLIAWTPVSAQINNPPNVSAAVVASLPTSCPTPATDTLNGTAGVGAICMPLTDAARPTPVQAANTTLAADCTFSVTFARATASATPIVHANVVLVGATQPIPCVVTARSSSATSGKCFPAQTTTLNLSIITAGLNLAPFGATCAAGTPVMIVVRDPTQ